jgi:hypothetical protein
MGLWPCRRSRWDRRGLHESGRRSGLPYRCVHTHDGPLSSRGVLLRLSRPDAPAVGLSMTACKNPVASCAVCAGPVFRRGLRTCSNRCSGIARRGPWFDYPSVNGRREHVGAAEVALGHPVPKGWEVHHINEIKVDNRPENLVVCQSRRLHVLLHKVPSLLARCIWLGPHGSSVRLFKEFVGPNEYFCVQCHQVKCRSRFDRSRKYTSGIRGECRSCRGLE